MKSLRVATAALVGMMLVSGCKKDAPAEQAAAPAADTARGTQGMSGMPGMSGSTAMMSEMETHLSGTMGMAADSMKAMLPTHRQMVANMLSQFGQEMRDMNMTADASWNALADSVRSDLTRMPDLNAPDLKGMMDAHAGRVRRLMDMHRAMSGGMGGMKM